MQQFICCNAKNPEQVPVPEGITCTAPALWFTVRNKIRQPGLLLTAFYCHWMQLARAFLYFYLYLPAGAESSRVQALSREAFGRVPRWVLVSSIPTHRQSKRMSSALSACLLCGARFVLLPASANLLLRVWGFFFFSLPCCCLRALLELEKVGKEEGNQHPSTSEVKKKYIYQKLFKYKKLVWKCYYCSS